MLSSNEFDLLMFTNSGFRVGNVEICEVLSRNENAQESRFQSAKRSEMCSSVMKGLRFADNQESCFKAWKRSHMGSSALLCGRFADSEESRFEAPKRSIMGSSVQEGGPSADILEF